MIWYVYFNDFFLLFTDSDVEEETEDVSDDDDSDTPANVVDASCTFATASFTQDSNSSKLDMETGRTTSEEPDSDDSDEALGNVFEVF